MKKQIILASLSVITMGIIGVAAISSVSAYQGDPTKVNPNCTEEQHTAMEAAMNNNDYDAWKELKQGKGRVTQVINEGNFSKFVEAHKLAEDGKIDEANVIRKELGLGMGNRMGKGHMAK